MTKLIAILATAAAFGGMVFFAAVVAPLVFAKLPTPTAGAFIRQVFPVYYLVMAAATAVGAVLSTAIAPTDALLLAGVSVAFLFARLVMLPRIDQARALAARGDATAAARFRLLHRLSTVLNAVQLVAVTLALIRLTGHPG